MLQKRLQDLRDMSEDYIWETREMTSHGHQGSPTYASSGVSLPNNSVGVPYRDSQKAQRRDTDTAMRGPDLLESSDAFQHGYSAAGSQGRYPSGASGYSEKSKYLSSQALGYASGGYSSGRYLSGRYTPGGLPPGYAGVTASESQYRVAASMGQMHQALPEETNHRLMPAPRGRIETRREARRETRRDSYQDHIPQSYQELTLTSSMLRNTSPLHSKESQPISDQESEFSGNLSSDDEMVCGYYLLPDPS